MVLMYRFLGFMFLGCLLFCKAEGAIRHYDFVVKESNFTRLCSTKSMLAVNDSFPGPEIHVHKGDTVFVNVHNQGTYGVTIHWHGVKMPRNPWSDGPEFVTQCPIPAGTNFTQEINFSTEEGILWWHAHSDWSRATVHGAIIVYPAHGTSYPYPKPYGEQTIVLASWFKADVMEVYQEAVASGAEFNTSDDLTINGQPGALFDCSTASNFTTKFRSLASSDHPISVPKNITKHILMTVSVNLIFCPNDSCSGTSDGDRLAASLNNQSFVFPTTDILETYTRSNFSESTTDFLLEPPIYFNFTGDVNLIVYTRQGTKVIELEYGDVVELVYQGTIIGNAQNHPMHLHGFSFYLVGTGLGNFNNQTDPDNYNLIDPPEINTIQLPKNGWAAIRFVADNPGVWFLHCHFERHTTWGMSVAIIVKNGGTTSTSMRSRPAYMPPCPKS
ncbi:hypothetical protein QYF36_001375 [Acer negundo]|nr:hypothetical protein QYF36_001375 [Acer negundo]